MKRKIVGLSSKVFHWNDKKTGEPRHGLNVFVEGKSKDTIGLKVWQIFVDDTFSSFGEIAMDIDHNRYECYINTDCNIEYNENGFVEEISFNPKPLVAIPNQKSS